MLKLRKVTGFVHAQNAYRVVMTLDDGSDLEIGSIGLQMGAHNQKFWSWGLDSILARQAFPTDGKAVDREDAMAQFKAMWGLFTADQARPAEFIATKLKRLPR